jgi:hypothetical protein
MRQGMNYLLAPLFLLNDEYGNTAAEKVFDFLFS